MLSLDYIRENKDKVKQAAINKNRDVDLDAIIALDDKRKELITQSQEIRQRRNECAKSGSVETMREEGKRIKEELKKVDDELRKVEGELNTKLLYVPNVPLEEVPVGKSESDNVEIKKWGEPADFPFKIKSHIELGEDLDIIDMKNGASVSGFRGYFLKGKLAQVHFALLFYTFQKLIAKGYEPVIAPAVVKEFTLFGSAHFPWAKENDVYALNDEDAYLAGTAEVPVMAMNANSVFKIDELPKKYVAISPCFRREAGSYGRDTKGLYRVHEFWKVEQLILSEGNMDSARALHGELQENCEEIVRDLELPYRVMLMNTSDLGEPQMLKYDTEVWMPSREAYGETGSNSIMGDFQCRRLNIKYIDENGEKRYCYSLNNTALASPRILIALLENHQKEDGSVHIPKALHNLIGFDTISE